MNLGMLQVCDILRFLGYGSLQGVQQEDSSDRHGTAQGAPLLCKASKYSEETGGQTSHLAFCSNNVFFLCTKQAKVKVWEKRLVDATIGCSAAELNKAQEWEAKYLRSLPYPGSQTLTVAAAL